MKYSRVCYLLVLVASLVLLVMGLNDMVRKPEVGESGSGAISRQIRGLGLVMVSQVVLLLGSVLCYGMGGGIKGMLGRVGSQLGAYREMM